MIGVPGALDLIATADLAGICRGRSVPEGAATSVGWVPANLGINAFGTLADNPFGSVGDLRLRADKSTAVRLPTAGAPITLMLGDLLASDGSDWACCPRTLLRRALEELTAQTGLTVLAAFEHEFAVVSSDQPEHPFSVQAMLAGEPFGTQLVGALARARLDPENWLPEFGNHQWEVTTRPAEGVSAADRAILLREIVRAAARATRRTVTFTPTPPGCGAMNGAHIHFSLWSDGGEKAVESVGGLSADAVSFAAGVIEHASAVLAFTAPSVVSYDRLGPGHWSVDSPRLAAQDREALLRIPGRTPAVPGREFRPHLEYRAADSTANPWLALGALVRAGMDGVLRRLPAPGPVAASLPHDLDEALSALEKDELMSSWLPADLLRTYLSVKRAEIDEVAHAPVEERHARYARAY